MDEDNIEKNDIVDVFFTASTSLFGCRVIEVYNPDYPYWVLRGKLDGMVHNVVTFERMDLVEKASPYENSDLPF